MTAVPALNIIASLLYISMAGATMFLLKLATKPLILPSNNKQKAEQPQESSKIYRRIALSWFKKYSIIGSITMSDRKYLAKQLLIASVYGVACLKINKITLWPVTLITFLLPAVFFLYQMLLKLKKNSKNEQQSKNTNQVNIQIQCEVVEGTKVVQNRQITKNKKQNKQYRNLYQLILISIFTFITVVLQLQTVLVLDKSISNSGQLNLISVFCIVLMDQFLLRPFSGLIFIGAFKLLQYKSIVSLNQSQLVFFLCQQILQEELIEQENKRAKAQLQSTQSHLKSKQQEVVRETNVAMKPSIRSMVFIDLDHIKPYEKQILSPHEALCQSKVIDDEQIYLTTPQKQLFELDIYGNNQQTIINSSLCNKQNAQNINNNSQSLYQKNEKKQINCFEELILTRDHDPLKNLLNLEPTFKTQQQYAEEKKKSLNKKKNRRILKLTGNSPYLQYLPNMLKNVRKAQNTAATTDVTSAPKLAELNFR